MKKRGAEESTEEMVSFNKELFSLEGGNLIVEELEQRLELAVAAIGKFTCGTFVCGRYSSCDAFGCGDFKTI